MNDTEILRWQEAVSSLPDKQFFNIMRLYLGEIKTPYNKQRLTQQLAAFIRREENLSNLLTLVDRFDVTILTAISLIPNATQQTLIEFFRSESLLLLYYTTHPSLNHIKGKCFQCP